MRLDAIELLPRCNLVEELLEANDEKRYDPLGRNIWARHDRLSLAGIPVSTQYLNLHHVGLDQELLYEQVVGAANRSGRYVNTPDGTPLAVIDNNNDREFLHRDGQGDTVLAIDDAGVEQCAPAMDQWGESDTDCDNPALPASPNRKWYNSSRLDTATDTYQWGDRTYNPNTATWQQPDTPALSGAPSQVSIGTDPLVANRYSYVNGDPINYTDPTGHILEECATGEYVCTRRGSGALVPDATATERWRRQVRDAKAARDAKRAIEVVADGEQDEWVERLEEALRECSRAHPACDPDTGSEYEVAIAPLELLMNHNILECSATGIAGGAVEFAPGAFNPVACGLMLLTSQRAADSNNDVINFHVFGTDDFFVIVDEERPQFDIDVKTSSGDVSYWSGLGALVTAGVCAALKVPSICTAAAGLGTVSVTTGAVNTALAFGSGEYCSVAWALAGMVPSGRIAARYGPTTELTEWLVDVTVAGAVDAGGRVTC